MKKLLLLCLAWSLCLPVFSQNPVPENVLPNPHLYVIYRYYLINRVFPHSDISPVYDNDVLICQNLSPDNLAITFENKTDQPMTVMLKNGSLIINGTAYKVLYEMNGYLVNYPIEVPPHSAVVGVRVKTSRAMFYPYRLKEAAKKYGIGAQESVSHLSFEFPIMIDGERRFYKFVYETMWISGKYKRQHGYKRDRNQTWFYRYDSNNPMNL